MFPYDVVIALALVLASVILGIRNVYTFWGSWEPVRRALKPNPNRPLVYVPQHGYVARIRNQNAVRASSLVLTLFHERVWNTQVLAAVTPAIEAQHAWSEDGSSTGMPFPIVSY